MSRPTISRMMRSSLIGASRMSMVETVAPSRITVTLSAISRISFSLWLMMMQAMPCARNSLRRSSSARLSFSCRLAVGSSRISSRTSLASALAISTSCCLPTPSLPTGVVGSSRSPTLASSSRLRAKVSGQSITPRELVTSLPRKMFSAIESSGTSASSWWMMMIPSASLSEIERKAIGRPS